MDRLLGIMEIACTAGEGRKELPDALCTALILFLFQIFWEQCCYFIQHITNGGAYVDKTMYCAQISDLISSIIIYLCSFGFFFKYVPVTTRSSSHLATMW